MTAAAWQGEWLQSPPVLSMNAWRGVESQHKAASLRLVDSLEEQDVLEMLLEGSKPPKPDGCNPKDYLLFTPFRYFPEHPSRFRKANSRGQWYGAETLEAACTEVAYWRQRFLLGSAGLVGDVLITEHTFFQAHVHGVAIDLMAEPWVQARELWTHHQDYAHTQALAEAAEPAGVQWIRYESVRAPGHSCAVALDVAALSQPAGMAHSQSWTCVANRDRVRMFSDSGRFSWDF